MAEISTIARPYAEALYRIAAKGDSDTWAARLTEMAQIAANPEMQAVMGSPKLTQDQIYAVFASAVEGSLAPQEENLLRTLVRNDRLAALPEIAAQFHALKNEREGTADAEIISAFPMTDEQVAKLMTALEKKFKVKLIPTLAIDSSLIGGVRVVVGDEVFDTSIRTRLEKMRVALSA